ncbi:hypothetical protein GQ457_15G002800 [Hibiscus cannabinus]
MNHQNLKNGPDREPKELTCLVANLRYPESLIIEMLSFRFEAILDRSDFDIKNPHSTVGTYLEDSIRFRGPCLRCFRYRGQLVSFKFEASCEEFDFDIKAPYYILGTFLEDVMLDLRQGPVTKWKWDIRTTVLAHGLKVPCYDSECTDNECFKKILRAIDRVKSLTICRWFFEQTMCKNVYSSSGGPEFCFDRLKELWWIDCSMAINALLCFLRHCLKLERLYVTIDPECYDLSSSTDKFPATVSLIAPGNLHRLEFVKLEGFADEETENFAARQLRPLFGERNPVIKSKSGGKCVKHLVKVAVLETEGKYPYKFEVVENVVGHVPNHVHMNL